VVMVVCPWEPGTSRAAGIPPSLGRSSRSEPLSHGSSCAWPTAGSSPTGAHRTRLVPLTGRAGRCRASAQLSAVWHTVSRSPVVEHGVDRHRAAIPTDRDDVPRRRHAGFPEQPGVRSPSGP
jgi:hypothetical protein